MKFVGISIGQLLLAILTNAASPSTRVRHEERDLANAVDWVKKERLRHDYVVPVRIGLKQKNLDKGYDLLVDVSHPSSPNYGKYYTQDEVVELFGPAEDLVEAVRNWVKFETGREAELSVNKQWLQLDLSVRRMEALLDTEYFEYEHVPTGDFHLGCERYHLPAEISTHVDYITPGVKFISSPRPSLEKRRNSKRRLGYPSATPAGISPASAAGDSPKQDCDRLTTPRCIKLLYNVNDTLKPQKSNSIGVYEKLDLLQQESMNLFYKTFANHIPQNTYPTVRQIDGALNPLTEQNLTDIRFDSESTLDFQTIYPLVYPEEIVLYQVDDDYYTHQFAKKRVYKNGFFNTFLDALDGSYCNYTAFGMTGNSPFDPVYPNPHKTKRPTYQGQLQCGKFKPTNVISLSYGANEVDYPTNYQRRQCNEFMKLGLQGVSVVQASGDAGVALNGIPRDRCSGPDKDVFGLTYPATCPYLTVAGGTDLPRGGEAGIDLEHGIQISGGGFSNIYPAPRYQKATLDAYFKNHKPPYLSYSQKYNKTRMGDKGVYNRAGRGIPDVSAAAFNIATFMNSDKRLYKNAGTSASTPIFAALLARINSARIAAGKSTVGFVNPVLYENPSAFNDVVAGNNPGCKTDGFYAVEGWDPVTGLGTPDYGKLKEVFMALP